MVLPAMQDVAQFLDQYPFVETAMGLVVVLLLAYVADRVAKRVFLAVIGRVARETSFEFDDVLLEYNVFGKLAHLAPALALYYGIQFVPGTSAAVDTLIQHAAQAAMILVGVSALGSFLTAVGKTYATSPVAQGRPIEAYIQIAKIALNILAGVLVIATLTGRSPLILLSGIGALMAVILLVFKDTILSFVASLQMASYDMIRVGDWIQMDQYGADGDVIELSLHSVKIQNFDKTITAIPTNKLIEQPFKNWRGMQESGGRRIKRSFHIDMSSIRFLTDQELDRLERLAVLGDYVREKRKELAEHNSQHPTEPGSGADLRRLTNVGTLRAYLVEYLRRHPSIRQDMTLIVRQLDPSLDGLPIQLYVFANTTAWVAYEDIQSDIFDHIFSILPEFGLRAFQAPTDFATALAGSGAGLAAGQPDTTGS